MNSGGWGKILVTPRGPTMVWPEGVILKIYVSWLPENAPKYENWLSKVTHKTWHFLWKKEKVEEIFQNWLPLYRLNSTFWKKNIKFFFNILITTTNTNKIRPYFMMACFLNTDSSIFKYISHLFQVLYWNLRKKWFLPV